MQGGWHPKASKGSPKGVEGVMFFKTELGENVEIRPCREVTGIPDYGIHIRQDSAR